MIKIIDPRKTLTGFPYIVLSNAGDVIGDIIDIKTDIPKIHPVSHAMESIKPGFFDMQGLVYEQVPMDNYLKKGGWLAFVQLVNNNPAFSSAFTVATQQRLALPWWKRFYNFVEIFGQAIGQPEISFPGLFDCSMIDVRLLKLCAQYLPSNDQVVINAMSNFMNPEQLWQIILNNSSTFLVYGIWDATQGGVIV